MKKNTTGKNQTTKKSAAKSASKIAPKNASTKQTSFNPWSLSIYVYWFIILFFIAATFYILGRSHSTCTDMNAPVNNVEIIEDTQSISEEKLMQASDYYASAVEIIEDTQSISEEKLMQASDYYASAREKIVAGNFADAIVDLTAAIDAGNATADMYILRGEAYMQTADYRRALADFNSALEIDAVNAIAYYDRALLNMRLEDYNTALADINNALASQTANPSPVLNLRDLYAKRGQLNLWLKNWEGAIADYTNSLARPDGVVNPTVYADRAEAYTQLGNYTEAVNDYASAIRVISEQIQGATTTAERESLSSNAMSYFEKSAALNLALGNTAAARSDLDSAYTIAAALVDTTSMDRIQNLISELQQ